MTADQPEARSYDQAYSEFGSPLMRQIRQEAYGHDIGQHSWVTAEELLADISRLNLSPAGRFLDLGCGPGGPLTFIASRIGCRATGMDLSAPAIGAARARSVALGLEGLVTFQEADLNRPLPFPTGAFNAVISIDVVLHLRDRGKAFQEVARILSAGGRFLFTDAGVICGSVSNEDIRRRAIHGYTQFAPAGFNERMLELAGFALLYREDRTATLVKSANGRLAARLAHRDELERLEGSAYFEGQQQYLETAIALAQSESVGRMMYLAESRSE